MVTESTNESSSASSSSSSSSAAAAAAAVRRWSGRQWAGRGGRTVRVVSPESITGNTSRNEALIVVASIIYNHRSLHRPSPLSSYTVCILLPPLLISNSLAWPDHSCRAFLIRHSLQNDRSIIIDPKSVIITPSHSTRPANCSDVLSCMNCGWSSLIVSQIACVFLEYRRKRWDWVSLMSKIAEFEWPERRTFHFRVLF